MTNMWMVRAGKNAILIDEFEKLNVVAIGWGLGDLTDKTPDEIKELVYKNYPNNSNLTNGKIAANEIKFRHEIKEGDYVLSYNSWTHHYLFGKIVSDYYYDSVLVNEEFSDVRDVEWLGEIPKDKLKKSTQNTLGAQITVFYIKDEAKEDILNVFNSGELTGDISVNDQYNISAKIIRTYLDENNLGNLEHKDIENLSEKFRMLFGPDVLEKLEGLDIINKIFLHDGDSSTLCYTLEYSQEYTGGGIGGGSAFKYSLFKSGKTHEWTMGPPQKQKTLTESEAIEVGSKIRDAIVDAARHIESSNLDILEDFIRLEDDLKEIFSTCIVRPSSTWIHKYFVLTFPDKFLDVHSDKMKVEFLEKFRIEPLKGYYVKDGQFYELARRSGVKLYSLLDEEIVDLFEDNIEEDSFDGGKEEVQFESDLKRNIIYFGAPGTGKSYNLNIDKDSLLQNYPNNYERVTFHPDYSYANFVGTYKPVPEDDSITYKYVPGPFMRVLAKALNNPNQPYLLIIEEINRANVAAVFGDVFQLLDRTENNDSEYPINTSEDMKEYLKAELNEELDKIKIPQNMFIWATMNSADQGVFPMDTAFKRRWDFKYFGIDNNENLVESINVNLNGVDVNWNLLRKAINDELLSYKINEDKLLGPFFAFNEFMIEDIKVDTFKDIFKNKIIMYLFEDAARSRRNELFSGVGKNTNLTYSQICDEFDRNGIEIFTESIKDKFLSKDGD